MRTDITVEVHCLQPRWVDKEGSIYRLFLDEELMSERTWLWGIDTLIRERFTAELDPEAEHIFRLEVLKTKPTAMTQLTLKKLTLNRQEYQGLNGQGEQINFNI